MSVVPMRTFDCKIPGCDGEAQHDRGYYAYLCEYHKEEKVQQMREAGRQGGLTRAANAARGSSVSLQETDSFEGKAKSLVQVGKRLDLAVRRFKPAREDLDEAMREWKAAVAKIGGAES